MLKKLNTIWRVIFTGLSFFLFGLGGLVLGLLVFPPLLLLPHAEWRERFARRTIQSAFKVFIGFMRFFGVLSYETQGFDQINQRRGLLIIANHPTLLDTVFLMSLLNNVDCIIKAALFRNLFTRGPVKAAGYIPNHAENADQMVRECILRLRCGHNVLIFPEGTRSVSNQPYKLQRGAANVAVRGQINLTPIQITCTPPTLRKGEKWYNVPPRKMHFCLTVHQEIDITPYLSVNPTKATRQLTDDLTHLFTEGFSYV